MPKKFKSEKVKSEKEPRHKIVMSGGEKFMMNPITKVLTRIKTNKLIQGRKQVQKDPMKIKRVSLI